MKKRGELLDENIIKIIIAVVVVALLIYVMGRLLTSSYDRGDEMAKSYFESFKVAIEELNSAESSSFYILKDKEDKLDFYLVYFGGKSVFQRTILDGWGEFSHDKKGNYDICICYWQGSKMLCRYCMDMKMPVNYNSGSEEEFVMGEGSRIKMIKGGENYAFAEI